MPDRKTEIKADHNTENKSENGQCAETPHTYQEWLHYGKTLLQEQGVADAETDAWLLMEYVSAITRVYYAMHDREKMDEAEAQTYEGLLKKRASHIPVQYITGEAWFYGYSFRVTPDVLIPRLDTEVLVEQAELRILPGMNILDMCTGSGCILLSILKRHSVSGVGADLSERALDVARSNQKRIGVRGASWIRSDLFQNIGGTFSMIVSNPPYIASAEIETLSPEVRDYEPRQALDGRADGLYFEKKIAGEARKHLKPGGWLLLEIGCGQGKEMREYLAGAGYQEVEIIKDLGGNDRVAAGRTENV